MGDFYQQTYAFIQPLMVLGYTAGTFLLILSTYIATTRGLQQAAIPSMCSFVAFFVAVAIHVLFFS
jgi:hypothetical protein